MTVTQWKLIVRFMFNVMYLLNRKSNTPTNEGNWTLEYDLEVEFRRLAGEGEKI